jgi:hypothetical protein
LADIREPVVVFASGLFFPGDVLGVLGGIELPPELVLAGQLVETAADYRLEYWLSQGDVLSFRC